MIGIDGRDHASVGESASPFDDRPITGERSRFDSIACEKRLRLRLSVRSSSYGHD